MPTFSLELELVGVYSVDMPIFEIWVDGSILAPTYSVSSAGTSISLPTVSYGGALPSSIEFRFNDGSAEGGRTIEIQSVKINDKYVNTSNFLSSDSITNGGNSNVNVTDTAFIFDASEPGAGTFTPATQTFTGGNDRYRDDTDNTAQTFDMLGGRDVAFLRGGDDTVSGGAGNDYIRGGAGNDLIYGAADNDRLHGEDGDDLIYGGTGIDTIFGGNDDDEIHGNDGNDRLHGQAGDDVITGGAGNDVLTGGTGTNFLFGDAGDDLIIGDSGVDTIDGGDDDDVLYGGGGDDVLNGGDGIDILVGDTGDDILNGDDGDDVLYGKDDDDELNGGAGDDTLFGGDNGDTLNGGADDDFLHGQDGNDTLNGGSGNDAIYGDIGAINFSSGLLVLEAEDYETKIDRGGKSWTTVSDAAASGGQVVIAQPNTGTILASTGIEDTAAELTYTVNFTTTGTFYVWIKAGVASGGSNDSVHLGFDGVQQTGNGGVQTGSNYGWHNTETGTGTVVTVNVTTTGEHTLNLWMREDGAPIDKIIIADTAAYTPTGMGPDAGIRTSTSGGVDTINGGTGDDRIYGDLGNDILSGGADDDRIYGGADNDTLNGDAGSDTLIGGTGVDTIDGGADNDTILLANGDFAAGESIDGGANNDELILTNATTVDFTTGTLLGVETLTGSTDSDDVTMSGIQLNSFNTLAFDNGTDILNITSTSTGLNGLANGSITGLETVSASTAAAGVTIDLTAQTESFTIIGSNNNDTLTGGAGADTINGGTGVDIINGGAGNDIIYGSDNSAQTDIADILAANAGVTYNESTGNFYQFVAGNGSTNFTWFQSNTAANAATLNGATGHLVTITSGEEQSHLDGLFTGNNVVWTAGGDSGTEGVFQWLAGPETGVTFWNGGATGEFTDWFTGTPQNNNATNDHMLLLYHGSGFDAEWYVFDGTSTINTTFPPGYIVEWEGDAVLGTTGTNTLSGGDGSDTLYGTDAVADTFVFLSGETGTDTIENFVAADTDAIDISDLLTGYTAGVSDINDFVQFTNSGANTLIQVDANGTTGGASFTTIGQINGVNDLDADALLYNASIIA